MKRIFLLAVGAFSLFLSNAQAQLVKEHTYKNQGGLYGYGSTAKSLLTQIDGLEDKYLFADAEAGIYSLYNVDHSLFKQINVYEQINSIDGPYYPSIYKFGERFVFTKDMFDSDEGLEYALQISDDTIKIFNEDGSLFQTFGSGSSAISIAIEVTSEGNKLTVSHWEFEYREGLDSVEVYSLNSPVTSTQNLKVTPNNLKVYPNPSTEEVTIKYVLSEGADTGKLLIFDLQGRLVGDKTLGQHFEDVKIDVSGFSSGTYIYKIEDGSEVSYSGKFVVQ